MNRWSKNGVLQRVFEALQIENIINIKMESVCIDSTIVKVHQNGTGALKKQENNQSENQKAGLTTKIHIVTASDRAVVDFILTGGERNDSPVSIDLLDKITKLNEH